MISVLLLIIKFFIKYVKNTSKVLVFGLSFEGVFLFVDTKKLIPFSHKRLKNKKDNDIMQTIKHNENVFKERKKGRDKNV